MQDTIADGQKPGSASHYDEDGLFDAFKTDASKTEFTIDGQHFARAKENAGPIADKFKEAIASPQHRKVISTVLNRGLRTIIANSQTREELPPTKNFRNLNLSNVKGFEMLLTVPQDNPLVRILDEHLDPRAAILACNLECRRILHDIQLQLESALQNRHNIIKTHAHIIP